MDANLQRVYEQIMQADHAEDLFGSKDIVLPVETLLEFLRKTYEPMNAATDPARYKEPEDIELATDANKKLQRLYALAKERIARHIFGLPGRGKPRPSTASKFFDAGRNRYYFGTPARRSERAVVYEGFLTNAEELLGEVTIKVAADATQNHLIQNEVRAIDLLHNENVPQWKHLPFLMDRFSSGERLGIIFRKISGVTLANVRTHRLHKNGVDQRHMVWMLDRLLSCLGYAHRCGIVHGNLNPQQIVIHPLLHNVVIDGWEAAVEKPAITGAKILLHSAEFSAPEVRLHQRVGPWSDIYSVGKLMIWLLGGDLARNAIPGGVESEIADFLHSLVQEDPYKRPADAWKLHEQQIRIKDGLWPRKFLHLDLS